MKKRWEITMFILGIAPSTFATGSLADTQKIRDREAILAMAGTFEVSFHFEETVAFIPGYELKPAYDSAALESIIVDEESENKIVLQHILKTERGIIKHWRQDWIYENTTLMEFQGHGIWQKRELTTEEVRGTWTQKVYQVDDSLRYESFGRWVHLGNLSQWESQATNRPLPRREYTKRSDYHVLVAHNRQALSPNGWVHEQDNFKLIRDGADDRVIARETGLNRYIRTAEDRGAEARQWWRDHREFWVGVRQIWDEVVTANSRIQLKSKVDDQPLYRFMFNLDEQALGAEICDRPAFHTETRSLLARFMASEGAHTDANY